MFYSRTCRLVLGLLVPRGVLGMRDMSEVGVGVVEVAAMVNLQRWVFFGLGFVNFSVRRLPFRWFRGDFPRRLFGSVISIHSVDIFVLGFFKETFRAEETHVLCSWRRYWLRLCFNFTAPPSDIWYPEIRGEWVPPPVELTITPNDPDVNVFIMIFPPSILEQFPDTTPRRSFLPSSSSRRPRHCEDIEIGVVSVKEVLEIWISRGWCSRFLSYLFLPFAFDSNFPHTTDLCHPPCLYSLPPALWARIWYNVVLETFKDVKTKSQNALVSKLCH